ncbi:tetratricopeptide repeat protein [Psychroserpens ponticola]|uniref:Tetratricopeptide repeat protein n=1 Tax=Psychroserpens ponticola TaxID=2932268 RepID=A0ABY7S349_9FLAO|nr:hypothetical protein [Psychroserpens ponticola]WCO03604.1 hypothetical protein MUN68_008855 [Psychroserpens ponticola]
MKEDYISMSMMLLAAGLIIYGHYRYGTVYIAFQELKKENYDKAEKLISKIKNPDLLSKGQKSYYHFTQGAIASNNDEWEKSYSEWSKAIEIGLRTENDTSIALLNLANVELERKNFDKANDFIAKVRELNLKPLVKSETDRIQNEINVAQQRV